MATKKMTNEMAMELIAHLGLDTRGSALNALIDKYVGKWGEGEREATRRLIGNRSHGLILNDIAVFDVDSIDDDLSAAAEAVFTELDWKTLLCGGR